MKTKYILLACTCMLTVSVYSQSRVVVNTENNNRTVITGSGNGGDIWAQLEAERLAAEKAEQERIAAEKAEQERLAAEKAEQERLAAEKAEQERLAAEKAKQERLAAEKAKQERIAAEKAEQARIAKEKAEQERLAAEKAKQERLAAEKAEQERIAAEKAEQARIAAEKAEQERLEKLRADSIKSEQHKLELAKQQAHRDSVNQARKERIQSYPWTNFIMLNGAYALYPEYAFGITYGRVKQGGFYINAMMNTGFKFSSEYTGDSNGCIQGECPFYTGEKKSTRVSATVGGLVRMHAPVYFYAGLGYGYRGLFYETTEGEWVAWHTTNTVYHGMHWEAGLMGNIKGFGISMGISGITDFGNIYYEGKLGLGYCF